MRPRWAFGEGDGQRFEPTQPEILAPMQSRWHQREIVQSPEDCFESKLTLNARERRAKTEVAAQPKATWRLSLRVRSRRSGSGKRSGSRFAAPITAMTACRLRILRPPSSTSYGAMRAVCWLGLS